MYDASTTPDPVPRHLAGHVLTFRDQVLDDLTKRARALKAQSEEAHEATDFHGVHYAKIPRLTVKFNNKSWGPRLVWVTVRTWEGQFQRNRTDEIPIGQGLKYRRSTFSRCPQPFRETLIAIEDEAAILREEVADWRRTFAFCDKVVSGEFAS